METKITNPSQPISQPNNPAPKSRKKSAWARWKKLWHDRRGYFRRLLISACVFLLISFTFFFFGPIEITAGSGSSVPFTIWQITPMLAAAAGAVFLAGIVLLPLLRGRIFNYVVCALFAVGLSGYIQGNFLNGSLGALTGDAVNWPAQRAGMLAGFAVWAGILLVVLFVHFMSRKIWARGVCLLCAALVVMQSVALIGLYTGLAGGAEKGSTDWFLSDDDMISFSKQKNANVILLDRLDYDYIEAVQETDSEFFDPLDGFVSFTNAISEHARTMPAANFMLTSCEDAFKVPSKAFFNQSWTGERNLLRTLHEADCEVGIYTDINNMFSSGATAQEYVDNLTHSNDELNHPVLLKNLLTLSAYRYAPLLMKPFFWCYTDEVANSAFRESKRYEIDESKYAAQLAGALSADREKNSFKFYHFFGPHAPYTLNEDGTKSDAPTDVVSQTKGSFQILYNMFDRMKQLGIYKDAAIIITADHGDPVYDSKPLQKATRIGLFYKPPGAENTPLSESKAPVSLENIPATVLKSMDLAYTGYARPLDEIKEGESLTRNFYKAVTEDGHEKELYIYEITGDAANFDHWKLKSKEKIQYPFY